MTPEEMINELLDTYVDMLSEEETRIVYSIQRALYNRGITKKQKNYIMRLLTENEMYSAGYSPYGDEYNYRIGL